MCLHTCNKQCVHAWWRLGGLEHFVDVLFRQRGLPSALPLGVLLLPPLEVLEGEKRRERGAELVRSGEKGQTNSVEKEARLRMRNDDRKGKGKGK